MSKEPAQTPSLLDLLSGISVEQIDAEIGTYNDQINALEDKVKSLEEMRRIICPPPKKTWSRKKKDEDVAVHDVTPAGTKSDKATPRQPISDSLSEIVDVLRDYGAMSIRKISGSEARAVIQKVPGTSSPVLYELIK